MAAVTLTIPAVPTAQPRVKATVRGNHAGVYTPQTIGTGDSKRPHPIHAFKATLRMVAQQQYQGPPLTGPLRIDCVFVFPRESSKVWKTRDMPRYPHTSKPDRDNLDKAVLDGLKGTVIADDASVYDGRITKWRAAGGEQPHCEIVITTDTQPPTTARELAEQLANKFHDHGQFDTAF